METRVELGDERVERLRLDACDEGPAPAPTPSGRPAGRRSAAPAESPTEASEEVGGRRQAPRTRRCEKRCRHRSHSSKLLSADEIASDGRKLFSKHT